MGLLEDYQAGLVSDREILNYINSKHKEEFIEFLILGIRDELREFNLNDFVNLKGCFIPYCEDVYKLVEKFFKFLEKRR